MTALAGYWDFTGDADPAASCRRMLASQAIYGEDNEAQWRDGPVALGRRLFSLLPEDRFDRGPIVGGEGSLALVGDIRLDNRDELASDLGLSPADCARLCDAAMLMRAFERWGEDAIPRLLGDFAVALWDSRNRRMLLVRDFQGQRPLHYHVGKRFVALASMPRGLHALADIAYRGDPVAAADFLALLPESGPASFFEAIQRVEPGHVVTIDERGVRSRAYWHPDRTTLSFKDGRDYTEAVRAELDAAVRRRLRGADGVVAAHLSAGLDSSAVTATAARLLDAGGGKVVAFTAIPRAGFDSAAIADRVADEGPLAALVAGDYANIEHVRVAGDGRSPIEDLDRYFQIFQRPVLNLVNSVWAVRIAELARARGINVMLTGTMGNLTFSYAGLDLLPQLLRRGYWLRLAREARQYGAFTGAGSRRALSVAAAPYVPRFMMRAIGRAPRNPLVELARITGLSESAIIAGDLLGRGNDFTRRTWRDSVARRLRALNGIDPGNYNKGMLGGWRIDTRDPTADRRLVELCLRIPLDRYFRDGVPRALARDVLADRVPRALLDEPRKGYQAADWYEGLSGARADLGEEIARLANLPEAAKLIDLDRMTALLDNWPSGDWEDAEVMTSYRLALTRSVSAGHFLRRASGVNN